MEERDDQSINQNQLGEEKRQGNQVASDTGIEQAYNTELVKDEGTGEMYEQIVWDWGIEDEDA